MYIGTDGFWNTLHSLFILPIGRTLLDDFSIVAKNANFSGGILSVIDFGRCQTQVCVSSPFFQMRCTSISNIVLYSLKACFSLQYAFFKVRHACVIIRICRYFETPGFITFAISEDTQKFAQMKLSEFCCFFLNIKAVQCALLKLKTKFISHIILFHCIISLFQSLSLQNFAVRH